MPTKIFKDKNRVRFTEYEARGIDANGDSQTVEHFETKAEALAAAPLLIDEFTVAAVVEKHVSRYPAHLFPGTACVYTVLAVFGDAAALEAGAWSVE